MKKFLFALLLAITTACYPATVDVDTEDYEGYLFNGNLSSQSPNVAFSIGGPDTGIGYLYLGNKAGDNGRLDDETDGEYSYQAVVSFRITPAEIPIGIPITDIKLGLSIQDTSFPTGSEIWVYPLKRTRNTDLLYTPTWNDLNKLTPFAWDNITNGLGWDWQNAHTSPVDVLHPKATITSTRTSSNNDDFTYHEVDIDSVYLGLLPTAGQGTPIDVSFLLMSGTNNSFIYVSNVYYDRDDPIRLRFTYGGNEVPTATVTDTPGGGNTPTFTPTVATPTPTSTDTVTATPTNTGTLPTSTPTNTGATPTPTYTVTTTWTRTPSRTPTKSMTPTATRTNTSGSTPTETNTFTVTPTNTTIPTYTPTNTADGSNTPTVTATWTVTQTPTTTSTGGPTATPTATYGNLLVTGPNGYPQKSTKGYLQNLEVENLVAKNITSKDGGIGSQELYLEGGVSVTRWGFTAGENARWNRDGNLMLDSDTYLTTSGILNLESSSVPPYYGDSWNAGTGIIKTKSTTNTGELDLGYDNAGFRLLGTSTTSGKLQIGSDLFIELDATDSALEFDNQNTSLRDPNAHLHFGAEQGGTGFGEAFIKWNTTENQFTIGDYTYPAPGSIPSVTIDTDTNSMIIGGDLTVMGSILGVEPVSIVNASQVTAGTFGDGSYVFQDNLTFSGTNPLLNFPNSDAIRYTNATAILDFYNGSSTAAVFDLDDELFGLNTGASTSFRLYVLNDGSSGPDYAIYGNNTSTEAATQYGVRGTASGASANTRIGLYGTATGSESINQGFFGSASGSTGTGYGADIANSQTNGTNQYGGRFRTTGTGPTNGYSMWLSATGATNNWGLWVDAGNTRVAGMLQLTDSGQQITVDTSANTFKFGNSSTADQFTIDTDNGNITFEGSMNPGSEFTVTGQLGYYDGTTFKGIASVGDDGEVLTSQGAGLPPVFEAVAGAHDAVTLDDDPYDYLSIASQVITLGQIDLSTDVTGDLPVTGIAALTASRAVVTNATGNISASAVTSTEVGYLSGVTSAIQTQLDAKAAKTFTANRALQSNSSTGNIEVSSTVDTTELGYLNGVTSAIQTQLNSKQATITGSATTVDTETLTALRAMATDASGKITVSSVVSSAELDFLDGVTSAVQTQLNAKVDETGTSGQTLRFTGTNTVAASSVIQNNGTDVTITGNVTMADAKSLVAETIKAVDTTGVVVNDKDGNLIATFTDGNALTLASHFNMANGTVAVVESLKAVDATGVVVYDKDSGIVATFGDDNSTTLAGDVTMANAKTLTTETIKAVDATGIVFNDKDGNGILSLSDANSVTFSSDAIVSGGNINIGEGDALIPGLGNYVTITKSRHSITSSSANAILDEIRGGQSGDILFISGTTGKTILVGYTPVNILCGDPKYLNDGNDWMMLLYDGSNWQMISYSQN